MKIHFFKLYKDEDSGEINFWTKKFYDKLLKLYFKEKIIEKENSAEPNMLESTNEKNNEEPIDKKNIENKDNALNKRTNILFEEFIQKCNELEDKYEKKVIYILLELGLATITS